MATKPRQGVNTSHSTMPPGERNNKDSSVLRYPNPSERIHRHGQLLLPPPSHHRDHRTSSITHHGREHSPNLSASSTAIHHDSASAYSMRHSMPQNFRERGTPPLDQIVPYRMTRNLESMSRYEYHTKLQLERIRPQDERQNPSNPPAHMSSSKQHYAASERNTTERRRLPIADEQRSNSVYASSKLMPLETTLTSQGRNGHELQKYLPKRSESLPLRLESSLTTTSKPKISTNILSATASESNSSSRKQPPLSSSSVRSREKPHTDHKMDAVTFSFKTGSCYSCGQQIRKRINQFSGTGLFEVPLTIPNRVYKGQCLICHPFNDVSLQVNKEKSKRKESFGLRKLLKRMSF